MSDPNNPNNPNKNVLKNTLLDELDNKQKTPNNQKITQKFLIFFIFIYKKYY